MKEGAVCVRDKQMDGRMEGKGLMLSGLQQVHLTDSRRLILSFMFPGTLV